MSFIGLLRTLEQLTRPPRRPNHDADEPLVGCPNPQDCREYDCAGDCSEADDAMPLTEPGLTPGMHTATDRLCVYTSANGIDTQAICGVCRPVRDIVEQMIEERYGDQSERADTQDAQMWRTVVGMYAKMDPRNCGYCGQPNSGVHKSDCKRPESSASVKSTPGTGAEPTSPAAPSTAGDSGEAVSGHSPRPDPASPRSRNPVEVMSRRLSEVHRKTNQGLDLISAVTTETSAVDSSPAVSDIPPSPAGEPPDLATWLEPAVLTVLDNHQPTWHVKRFECWDSAGGSCGWFENEDDWCAHVAPFIAAHIAQALPDYPAASPRHSFVGGLQAAANIVGAEAQRVWRAVLDSPSANPVLDGMTVARRLDAITQQLRDHATEYSTTK